MTDNVVHLHSKPRVTILPVLEDDFDTLLGIGMELIAPAIARQSNDVSVQDVEDDIRGGGAVMWLVHVEDTLEAAITTCVVKHPQRNTLKIEFMGGKRMKQWMDEAIDVFADLARRADLPSARDLEKIALFEEQVQILENKRKQALSIFEQWDIMWLTDQNGASRPYCYKR